MKRSNNFMRRIVAALAISITTLMCGAAVFAQTSAFTYQGRFTDTTVAQPTNGTYTMTFRLFDAATNGNQIPDNSTAVTSMVSVVNSIFTVKLDFGAQAFAVAGARYLEIQVGSTVLTPRQEITSTPFSQRATNAASADSLSSQCVGCVTNQQINSIDGAKVSGTVANATNSQQLGGTTASNFVQTNSTAFIRNQTTQQSSTDFNISGTGAANVFNAATQFNIGGNRVLGVGGFRNFFAGFATGNFNTGSNNSFVGNGAGYSNTTANGNSFFGTNAGGDNSTGGSNSFFGSAAGNFNTTGGGNSFVGNSAGANNLTGVNNSFVGYSAGLGNRSGSNNTLLGASANTALSNLTYATAIGAGAEVSSSNTVVLGRAADTVQIPGKIGFALGQGATTSYGTGGLTVTRTNQNFAVVPGLAQTITVSDDFYPTIIVTTDGGIQSLSQTSDGRSVVEVAVYIDSVNYSYRQYHLTNASISPAVVNWSISTSLALNPGVHTVEVRARSTSESFLSNATVSSNSGYLRGQLTVTTLRK